jgi:glycosyltransferase involved in cell wall biosynthesis
LGDLLVVPGTGGLVVSEAMTHGLPVISSTGDGVERDLIVDGYNGFCISDAGDDELMEAMCRCLDSPAALAEMGAHARRTIDEGLNIEQYLNEMLAGLYFAYNAAR